MTRYGMVIDISKCTGCYNCFLTCRDEFAGNDYPGYAAEQPDKLKVVGQPFSREDYGIGFKHGDTAFCQFLTETLRLAREDGSWADAFERTLGKAGVPMPTPPLPS